MVNYRCYILDAEDHILQAHELNCDTDMQAESVAEQLLADDPYHIDRPRCGGPRGEVKKLDRECDDQSAPRPSADLAGIRFRELRRQTGAAPGTAVRAMRRTQQ